MIPTSPPPFQGKKAADEHAEPSVPPWAEGAWRREMAGAITSPGELLAALGLPPELDAPAATSAFPLRVPRGLLRRIEHGNPDDPLLRQLLPARAELTEVAGFGTDPVGELGSEADTGVPGMLQKYPGRVLLVVTGACAVHCRYCFRRHFPYAEERVGRNFERALDEIARRDDVSEVILSGGDPLAVPDAALGAMVERIAELPHIERLRVHTRLPVVLPQRVDGGLLRWLGATRLRTVVVLHVNHRRELEDPDVATALRLLAGCGATLLNQAVLLRGVNDTVEAQLELSEGLFALGVLPYYLHLLDPVAGAAHFDVPDGEGRRLVLALRERLPGYLVPRLVREIPGRAGKTAVAAAE